MYSHFCINIKYLHITKCGILLVWALFASLILLNYYIANLVSVRREKVISKYYGLNMMKQYRKG